MKIKLWRRSSLKFNQERTSCTNKLVNRNRRKRMKLRNLQSDVRFEQVVDAVDGHILEKLVHDENHLKGIEGLKLY